MTELYETYKNCGYHVILSSALEKEGLEEIHEILKGKTTVVARAVRSRKIITDQSFTGRGADGDG